MKKIRNALIAAAVVLLIGGGSLYAVWRFAGSENKPVKVVPVSSLDYNSAYGDYYGYSDDSSSGSIEGSIVSRDSQHISLQSDLELKSVKVKEGDEVKAGDVLLVYDMTMKELEKEMADLSVQIARIHLAKAESDLEKLKSKYPSLYETAKNNQTTVDDISVMTETGSDKSASLEAENSDRTASDELLEFDDDDDAAPAVNEPAAQSPGETPLVSVEPEGAPAEEQAPVQSSAPLLEMDDAAEAEDQQADEDNTLQDIEISDDPDENTDDQSFDPDTSEDTIVNDEIEIEEEEDDEEDVPYDTENGEVINYGDDTISGDDGSQDLIEEDDVSLIEMDPDDEGDASDNSDTARIRVLVDFLSGVNIFSSQYSQSRYELDLDDIEAAQAFFEDQLGIALSDPAIVSPDAFLETSRIPIYILSPDTLELLGRVAEEKFGYSVDDMVRLLEQAYLRLLFFRLVTEMNEVLPNGTKVSELTDEQIAGMEDKLRRAAQAYYMVYYNWRYLADKYQDDETMRAYLKDYQDALRTFSVGKEDKAGTFPGRPSLGSEHGGQLSRLIGRLLEQDVVEHESEDMTEDLEPETDLFDGDFGGFGDDFGLGSDSDTTPEEEMYAALVDAKSKQLELRSEELKLKKVMDELEKGTVVAGIDGVVRQAGSVEEGAVMDDFIVIFGGKGLYAMGSVSEFKRDTIHVGDKVTGTTEEGIPFTAKITEISDYPMEGDSGGYNYFGSTTENTTASYYPFYAFIEDDSEISEGYATMALEKETSDVKDIQLEKMFIRQDPNGRSYVYVAGSDGKLEKRYVTVAAAEYYISVTDGITVDDLIAFPYGDNVKEGASTVEASSFYDDEDAIYW